MTALPLLLATLLASPAPGAARRDQPPFHEVNASHTSAAFRSYVAAALEKLLAAPAPIGKKTHAAISSGRIKLDELSDLTRRDFERARKELAPDGMHLKASDFYKLHDARTGAARAIRKALDGYQWDDRIYVARGLSKQRLAETLVHEVNHVANHSEKHYRTHKDVLREEYRAFYVERIFRGERMTAAKCKALKEDVIRGYSLRGVTPADVPDVPPGKLLP
jgi:hypothetical protein